MRQPCEKRCKRNMLVQKKHEDEHERCAADLEEITGLGRGGQVQISRLSGGFEEAYDDFKVSVHIMCLL